MDECVSSVPTAHIHIAEQISRLISIIMKVYISITDILNENKILNAARVATLAYFDFHFSKNRTRETFRAAADCRVQRASCRAKLEPRELLEINCQILTLAAIPVAIVSETQSISWCLEARRRAGRASSARNTFEDTSALAFN